MKVIDVYRRLDQIAPFDTQEAFDNSGLLTGHPDWEVTGALLTLDCTPAAVREAVEHGANLIISHHPLMFSPRKTLREDDPEAALLSALIRSRIALIACHTCLDKAPGGINDVLADRAGLEQVEGEGFLRVGNLPETMTAEAYGALLSERLHTVTRIMGDPRQQVTRVGLCSGAGSDEWEEAKALGADAFISGEIKHHHALAAAQQGVVCFECGHHATEEPGILALSAALQMGPNGVQWNLPVIKSTKKAYFP